MPGGKYTKAGLIVDESQPRPHRFPDEIAKLIAFVSSVEPSPDVMLVKADREKKNRLILQMNIKPGEVSAHLLPQNL